LARECASGRAPLAGRRAGQRPEHACSAVTAWGHCVTNVRCNADVSAPPPPSNTHAHARTQLCAGAADPAGRLCPQAARHPPVVDLDVLGLTHHRECAPARGGRRRWEGVRVGRRALAGRWRRGGGRASTRPRRTTNTIPKGLKLAPLPPPPHPHANHTPVCDGGAVVQRDVCATLADASDAALERRAHHAHHGRVGADQQRAVHGALLVRNCVCVCVCVWREGGGPARLWRVPPANALWCVHACVCTGRVQSRAHPNRAPHITPWVERTHTHAHTHTRTHAPHRTGCGCLRSCSSATPSSSRGCCLWRCSTCLVRAR
jgi:hypothetical protein